MVSKKNRRLIARIIPFGIISLLFGITYTSIEHGILGNNPIYPSTGNPYRFTPISSILLSMLAGLVIGTLEVLYLAKKFDNRGFFRKIAYKTAIYIFLIAILIFLISLITDSIDSKKSPLDPELLGYATTFLKSSAFWAIESYMALGIAISLFYKEVSDNIGQGILINFFTGKYHTPLEEDRVFMFLDMKDSTKIAEKLGHIKYFDLLREYYSDLTQPIIEYGGEIYQYVGDEVVVTWKKKKGKIDNSCIDCFFNMKLSIKAQAPKYKAKYGLVPSFKAGIHLGKVTTGEIGVIKKEIAFSGDVLNTTARIQSLCNVHHVDLLVSKQLVTALDLNNQYNSKELGEVELRGRDEKINLYSIGQNIVRELNSQA